MARARQSEILKQKVADVNKKDTEVCVCVACVHRVCVCVVACTKCVWHVVAFHLTCMCTTQAKLEVPGR